MKNKGITLVALVVTIVIMLILAGVSLNLSIGDRGIFQMSQKAAEEYEQSAKNEAEELKNLERYLAEIKEEKPVIKVSKLNEWTKEKELTIEGIDGCKIKYTTDGIDPGLETGEEYTSEQVIKIEKNCQIKAIYIKDGAVYGKLSEEDITKIDKNAPDTLEISLTPGKKSIQVSIRNMKDAEGDEESGSSGIEGIRFSKNNGNTWTDYQGNNTNLYLFDDIYGDLGGVTCNIQVEIRDYAGNTKVVSDTATTTCKNTTYYTNTKDQLISTINNRKFYKTNEKGAIVANWFHDNSHYDTPDTCILLVSPFEDGVLGYCDYTSESCFSRN